MNQNFFANAKKSNADEVKGWAFDFDKESETIANQNKSQTTKHLTNFAQPYKIAMPRKE